MTSVVWGPWCERLVRMAARGLYLSGADREDVLQEARLGVLEGLQDWRPGRGSCLDTFAVLVGRRRVIDAINASRRVKRSAVLVPLDEPLENGQMLADLLPDSAPDAAELREEVRRTLMVVAGMSALERRSVERSVAGLPLADKSEDNARQRAARKLRAAA